MRTKTITIYLSQHQLDTILNYSDLVEKSDKRPLKVIVTHDLPEKNYYQ